MPNQVQNSSFLQISGGTLRGPNMPNHVGATCAQPCPFFKVFWGVLWGTCCRGPSPDVGWPYLALQKVGGIFHADVHGKGLSPRFTSGNVDFLGTNAFGCLIEDLVGHEDFEVVGEAQMFIIPPKSWGQCP